MQNRCKWCRVQSTCCTWMMSLSHQFAGISRHLETVERTRDLPGKFKPIPSMYTWQVAMETDANDPQTEPHEARMNARPANRIEKMERERERERETTRSDERMRTKNPNVSDRSDTGDGAVVVTREASEATLTTRPSSKNPCSTMIIMMMMMMIRWHKDVWQACYCLIGAEWRWRVTVVATMSRSHSNNATHSNDQGPWGIFLKSQMQAVTLKMSWKAPTLRR